MSSTVSKAVLDRRANRRTLNHELNRKVAYQRSSFDTRSLRESFEKTRARNGIYGANGRVLGTTVLTLPHGRK